MNAPTDQANQPPLLRAPTAAYHAERARDDVYRAARQQAQTRLHYATQEAHRTAENASAAEHQAKEARGRATTLQRLASQATHPEDRRTLQQEADRAHAHAEGQTAIANRARTTAAHAHAALQQAHAQAQADHTHEQEAQG